MVRVEKQTPSAATTKYTLSVEKYKDEIEVTNFDMFDKKESVLPNAKATVYDNDTVTAYNGETARPIVKIEYEIDGTKVSFERQSYEDFFVDLDGNDLMVSKAD